MLWEKRYQILPYQLISFASSQPPINDHQAATGILGIRPSTQTAHIVRAILESIAFRVIQLLRCSIQETKFIPSLIRVDGGVSRNDFICQSIADLRQVFYWSISVIKPFNNIYWLTNLILIKSLLRYLSVGSAWRGQWTQIHRPLEWDLWQDSELVCGRPELSWWRCGRSIGSSYLTIKIQRPYWIEWALGRRL